MLYGNQRADIGNYFQRFFDHDSIDLLLIPKLARGLQAYDDVNKNIIFQFIVLCYAWSQPGNTLPYPAVRSLGCR